MKFPTDKVSGIVLAGGQSRRMGTDKAALQIGGKTFVESILTAMKPVFDEILVVGRRSVQSCVTDEQLVSDVRVVPDLKPGMGPLGGLHTALECTQLPVFVIGCDMPLVTTASMRWIISEAGSKLQNSDVEAVVCSRKNCVQPLFSIYKHNCKRGVSTLLEQQKRSLVGLIDRISETVVTLPDQFSGAVVNFNEPEQLRTYRLSRPS